MSDLAEILDSANLYARLFGKSVDAENSLQALNENIDSDDSEQEEDPNVDSADDIRDPDPVEHNAEPEEDINANEASPPLSIEHIPPSNHEHGDEVKEPLHEQYKIVQHIAMYGMREYDFDSQESALSHWQSISYLTPAIWYSKPVDVDVDLSDLGNLVHGDWRIKDSYGAAVATQRITNYMNDKYGRKRSVQMSASHSTSIFSYLSPFGSSYPMDDSRDTEIMDNMEDMKSDDLSTEIHEMNEINGMNGIHQMNESHDEINEMEDNAAALPPTSPLIMDNEIDPSTEKESVALMAEFMRWTQKYMMQKLGVIPLSDLNEDYPDCNDLIVSYIYRLGFQCYFLETFDAAQDTWKSRALWYSSVWFQRNAMGTFVVYDTFGSFANTRRICHKVNDSQESWNYSKRKRKIYKNTLLGTEDENDHCTSTMTKKGNTPMTPGDELDDSALCIVCMDEQKSHVMIPCGHICVCESCKALFDRDHALCPICRLEVQSVIKIFM